MIIYASAKFAKRLKCQISRPEHAHEQLQYFSSWSADLLQVYRFGQIAIMMNDASLATLIIPLRGISDLDAFIPDFLSQADRLFKQAGGGLDVKNTSVIVLRRNNRRLIGTLTDAMGLIKCDVEAQRVTTDTVDWLATETFVNKTPYSLIGYQTPMQRLKDLV